MYRNPSSLALGTLVTFGFLAVVGLTPISRVSQPLHIHTSDPGISAVRGLGVKGKLDADIRSSLRNPPGAGKGSRVACRISLKEAKASRTPIGEGRRGRHKNPNRVPNHHWRAVPWEDLREHPMFEPLPPPWEVDVHSAKDLARLRKDSRRFIRVHHGRLTTFQLPTILGLFEPAASDYLKIKAPLKNRHDKVIHARQDLIDSRAFELNKNLGSYITLAESLKFMDEELKEDKEAAMEPKGYLWGDHLNEDSEFAQAFARMYTPVASAPRGELDPELDLAARFGEAQQATGILTVLNIMAKEGATIKEAGLFPLEAQANIEDLQLPFPIGTAPDAMIKFPDGREEPLVIKAVTPFKVYRGQDGFLRTRVDRNSRPSKHVTSWHVPQMQLHMLCTGAKRGWLLYMSSFNGARLYRMERDDSYINMMAFWIKKFSELYGTRVPEENFFLGEYYDSYRQFLTKTRKIASSSFEHALVRQRWVQRSPLNTPFFVGDTQEEEGIDEEDYSELNEEADAQHQNYNGGGSVSL